MTTPTLASLDCRSCLNSGGESLAGVGGVPFSTCRADPPTLTGATHRMESPTGVVGWVGEYPWIAENKPCGRHSHFMLALFLGTQPQPVAASIELDAGHLEKKGT